METDVSPVGPETFVLSLVPELRSAEASAHGALVLMSVSHVGLYLIFLYLTKYVLMMYSVTQRSSGISLHRLKGDLYKPGAAQRIGPGRQRADQLPPKHCSR